MEKVDIKFLVIGVLLLNFYRMLMLKIEVDVDKFYVF